MAKNDINDACTALQDEFDRLHESIKELKERIRKLENKMDAELLKVKRDIAALEDAQN